MEINVGDYVRYKEFSYDKEVKIGKKIDIFGNVDTSRGRILEHNIIKHSKDIIDIVQAGDIVTICDNFGGHKLETYMIDNSSKENCIDTLKSIIDKSGYQIKKVLTKEQFEANAYVLEKEK